MNRKSDGAGELRPPALEGLPEARPVADGVRIAGWTLRGLLHGAKRRGGQIRDRAVSTVAFLGGCVAFPIIAVGMPVAVATTRGRFYMSPTRDAVLGISLKDDGWHIADHLTARPGTERGQALRDALFPQLLPFVDEHQVTVRTVAATRELGEKYRAEVEGLEFAGMTYPRGWRMIRRPRPLTDDCSSTDQ